MTFNFKLKKSGSKSKRKYPRQKVVDSKSLKELNYCKNNWVDDRYTYVSGNIFKFLKNLIGKPINYVYRKFTKNCNKNVFNPYTTLNNYIKGLGFYNDNGKLNYKDPKEILKQNKYNRKCFNDLDMKSILKTLWITKVSQCIGRFYVNGELKTIYINYNIPDNGKQTYVNGIGTSIRMNKDYDWELFPISKFPLKVYFYYK